VRLICSRAAVRSTVSVGSWCGGNVWFFVADTDKERELGDAHTEIRALRLSERAREKAVEEVTADFSWDCLSSVSAIFISCRFFWIQAPSDVIIVEQVPNLVSLVEWPLLHASLPSWGLARVMSCGAEVKSLVLYIFLSHHQLAFS
jgi:hypothetical protein